MSEVVMSVTVCVVSVAWIAYRIRTKTFLGGWWWK